MRAASASWRGSTSAFPGKCSSDEGDEQLHQFDGLPGAAPSQRLVRQRLDTSIAGWAWELRGSLQGSGTVTAGVAACGPCDRAAAARTAPTGRSAGAWQAGRVSSVSQALTFGRLRRSSGGPWDRGNPCPRIGSGGGTSGISWIIRSEQDEGSMLEEGSSGQLLARPRLAHRMPGSPSSAEPATPRDWALGTRPGWAAQVAVRATGLARA